MNGSLRTKRSPFRGRAAYVSGCLGVVLVALGGMAQETEAPGTALPTEPIESAATPSEAPSEAPQADAAAAIYSMKCQGCHTIGGGVLSGPDLKASATYLRQTVLDGIKRMEKNVGPISASELDVLTDFLLSADAAARLEAHREQIQMREAASMEPPSAAVGRALFRGKTPFSNGGAACAACHQAGGRGGNFAASLEDAFTRLGAQPLQATTESPGFPVMRAIYTAHPVTKQEAVHVVKYLEEVAQDPAPASRVPMHLAGLGGTVLVLVLLHKTTNKRVAGTRARMVSEACRRSDLGSNPRREK